MKNIHKMSEEQRLKYLDLLTKPADRGSLVNLSIPKSIPDETKRHIESIINRLASNE